ncbi:inositol monophosphatase family protein [Sodalis-like secondary symbiont of Drepanosiphum platanoidis]|uniref:inositol monophosphatase family protein n=1 Tax=Sodalis-like secondary symbiont of Drepanosiphum platanoidis TaxID=2994493 RepID=UPI0034649A96
MNPMLNISIISARKAGNFIMKYYELYNNSIYQKKKNNDFILEIKTQAKYIISKTIKKYYPNHIINNKILNNFKKENINENQWIINSIDGLNNFNTSFPFFCITIALRIKNKTEISLIYDPLRNEIFSAIRGKGAQINQYRLRINSPKKHNNSIISIKYSLKKYKNNFTFFNKIFNFYKSIRYTGSDSLNCAYLASGRIDGILNIGTRSNYKLIAGELIIRESGGLITDLNGNIDYSLSKNIIAGHSKFIKNILNLYK